MSDNIKPIREGVTATRGKQQYLDYIAQEWDRLAADGHQPACIVFAVVAESGEAATGYMTAPDIREGNTMHIAKGIMSLNADYNDWTRP